MPDKARPETHPPHNCRLLVRESLDGSMLPAMAVPGGVGTTCHFYTWGEGIERMRFLRLRGRERRNRNERHGGQSENGRHG